MSMDSWFPNPHDKDIAQLEEGLAYRAVKSGNNWILPSGKNAANGDPVVLDGTFGYATAAIVGGTDAIVEDTNWKPYGDGGALGALNSNTIKNTSGFSKIVNLSSYYFATSDPYYTENDGIIYITLNSSSADISVVTLNSNNQKFSLIRSRLQDGGTSACFVKKGTPLWISGSTADGSKVEFHPYAI